MVVPKVILHVVLKVKLIVLAALGNECLRHKKLGKMFLPEHQGPFPLNTKGVFTFF